MNFILVIIKFLYQYSKFSLESSHIVIKQYIIKIHNFFTIFIQKNIAYENIADFSLEYAFWYHNLPKQLTC